MVRFVDRYPLPRTYESKLLMPNTAGRGWVSCGQVRKGIAIATRRMSKGDDSAIVYYLVKVDNDNHLENIIFARKTPGDDDWRRGDDHEYEFYRSIKGYYVFVDKYNRDLCIPGKDRIVERVEYVVFDEFGNRLDHYDEKTIGIGQRCFDLGLGMVQYENNIYDLETLVEKMVIPKKFRIVGAFEENLLYLQAEGDYRTYFVLVRNGKILKRFDEESEDIILEQLEKEEVSNLKELIKFKGLPFLEFKKVNWAEFCQKYDHKYSTSAYGDGCRRYIAQDYNIPEFDPLSVPNICVELLEIIIPLTHYHAYKMHMDKPYNYKLSWLQLSQCYSFSIFGNLLIFRCQERLGGLDSHYVVFDTNGNRLSETVFVEYYPVQDNVELMHSMIDSPVMCYGQTESESRVFGMIHGQYVEYKRFGGLCFDGYGNPYFKDNHTQQLFDLDGHRIMPKYTTCKVQSVVENYLYGLNEPWYDESNCRYLGSWSGLIGDECDFKMDIELDPKPKILFVDGEWQLPYPKSYRCSIEEIYARHHNRPNYISEVSKIRDFWFTEGVTGLYKMECRPWGYCDSTGHIYYDFDIDNVEL